MELPEISFDLMGKSRHVMENVSKKVRISVALGVGWSQNEKILPSNMINDAVIVIGMGHFFLSLPRGNVLSRSIHYSMQ